MARKPRPIHFTHHVCLIADATTDIRNRNTPDTYAEIFGRRTRDPSQRGVLSCSPPGRAPLYTLNARKVTCAKCRRGVAAERQAPWTAERSNPAYYGFRLGRDPVEVEWVDDVELATRAWWLCCRHAGVQRPDFVPAERIARLDRALAVKQMWSHFSAVVHPSVVLGAERYRKDLEYAVARASAEQLEALRPALDPLTMIGDLLAAIDEMSVRADKALREVMRRMRDGELVATWPRWEQPPHWGGGSVNENLAKLAHSMSDSGANVGAEPN
jgi:hypothetical protein